MSRISLLLVSLLLLASCWNRHALEVSKNYVPVYNPGGVLFDEDENFAQSYEVYEKRRHDVLQEKARHRKRGLEVECERDCPKDGEEKKSWIMSKLQEFGVVSRDEKKGRMGSRGGMVNSEGVDLSTIPGARFIDISLDEGEVDNESEHAGHSRGGVIDSVDSSLESVDHKEESPRFVTYGADERVRGFGCDCDDPRGECGCDRSGVRHEHDSRVECDCEQGGVSWLEHSTKTQKTHNDAVGTAAQLPSGSADVDAAQCSCDKGGECEHSKVIAGHSAGGLGGDCECEKSHECGCCGGEVSGHKHKRAGTKRERSEGAAIDPRPQVDVVEMGVECDCEKEHDCECERGSAENADGGLGNDCKCKKSRECECGRKDKDERSVQQDERGHTDGVIVTPWLHADNANVGAVECDCEKSALECECTKVAVDHVDCECRKLGACDCSGADMLGNNNKGFNSAETRVVGSEIATQFGADTGSVACDCGRSAHKCDCKSGLSGHGASGSGGADCECGKSGECDCQKDATGDHIDASALKEPIGHVEDVSGEESVAGDISFEEEQRETVARWEIGEEAASDFYGSGAEKLEGGDLVEGDAEVGGSEFSDGLMEESFSMDSSSVFPEYDWSKEALEAPFDDQMNDVAFPQRVGKGGSDGKMADPSGQVNAKKGDSSKENMAGESAMRGLSYVGEKTPSNDIEGMEEYVAEEDDQSEDFPHDDDSKEEWPNFYNDRRGRGNAYLNYSWYGV